MAPELRRRWLDEVEDLARAALPPEVYRYVAEGARDEVTLGEAEQAWREVRLLPRVLRDVTSVDTGVELLGTSHALPLGIAPMTLQKAADPRGEVAMAEAAARCGVPMVLSSNSGSTFADVGSTGVTWWLQLYVAEDRRATGPLLEAAIAAGASAIALTVDTPVVATRFGLAEGPSIWEVTQPGWAETNHVPLEEGPVHTAGRPPKARDLTPADIAWLREETGLPVVLKGVLRADDARAGVDGGAEAIWVSNHGGRQLDRVMATARCLPRVRAAVGRDAQVYVDGGVRSGLDVLVATALGADAALVGRPMLHALAAGGVEGVVRGIEEIGEELTECLTLSGCATVAQSDGIACPDGRFEPVERADLREPPV